MDTSSLHRSAAGGLSARAAGGKGFGMLGHTGSHGRSMVARVRQQKLAKVYIGVLTDSPDYLSFAYPHIGDTPEVGWSDIAAIYPADRWLMDGHLWQFDGAPWPAETEWANWKDVVNGLGGWVNYSDWTDLTPEEFVSDLNGWLTIVDSGRGPFDAIVWILNVTGSMNWFWNEGSDYAAAMASTVIPAWDIPQALIVMGDREHSGPGYSGIDFDPFDWYVRVQLTSNLSLVQAGFTGISAWLSTNGWTTLGGQAYENLWRCIYEMASNVAPSDSRPGSAPHSFQSSPRLDGRI